LTWLSPVPTIGLHGATEVASMNPKKRPNHQRYIQVLKTLTPEERLLKAFELSAFAKTLFIEGLRKRFPNVTPEEFRRILLTRLEKCHNRNY
jgi:hypothetical protein